MSKKIILTGAPGSGKTTLIKGLELLGHSVIHEAATDVIKKEQSFGNMKPWLDKAFIHNILNLQITREKKSGNESFPVFFDRSPLCTLALTKFLKIPAPRDLANEIANIHKEKTYCDHVFFIKNLGFIQNDEVRQISFEETLLFEKIHYQIYLENNFKIIEIPPLSVDKRILIVNKNIERLWGDKINAKGKV